MVTLEKAGIKKEDDDQLHLADKDGEAFVDEVTESVIKAANDLLDVRDELLELRERLKDKKEALQVEFDKHCAEADLVFVPRYDSEFYYRLKPVTTRKISITKAKKDEHLQ